VLRVQLQVLRVPQDHKEFKVLREHKEPHKDSKVRQDHKVLKVLRGHKEPLKVLKEPKVLRVH
jgi:hypothetical protein